MRGDSQRQRACVQIQNGRCRVVGVEVRAPFGTEAMMQGGDAFRQPAAAAAAGGCCRSRQGDCTCHLAAEGECALYVLCCLRFYAMCHCHGVPLCSRCCAGVPFCSRCCAGVLPSCCACLAQVAVRL